MKFLFLLSLFSLLSSFSWAQKTTQLDGSGDFNLTPGYGVVTTRPLQSSEVEGSFYLEEAAWLRGDIDFGSQLSKMNDVLFRYRIDKNEIEVEEDGQIKVIPGLYVTSFEYKKGAEIIHYQNAKLFEFENIYLLGFFQVLHKGTRYTLLSKTTTSVSDRDGRYIPALNVGKRSREIIHQDSFYLYDQKKGSLIELSGKKKRDLDQIAHSDLEDFVKSQKLGFRQKDDLVKITQYLNSSQ